MESIAVMVEEEPPHDVLEELDLEAAGEDGILVGLPCWERDYVLRSGNRGVTFSTT